MTLRTLVALAVALCSACNCGSKAAATLAGYPDAPLADMVDAKQWTSLSAPNAYLMGISPSLLIGVSSLGPDAGTDPNCPAQTETDTTLHVVGGCTDNKGRQWLGTMDQLTDGPDGGSGQITYAGFGFSEQRSCGGAMLETKLVFDGTFSVSGAKDNQQFTVDLTTTSTGADTSCVAVSGTTATSYSGTITANSTWNGSGSAGNSTVGKVRGETKDEVMNGPCNSEAQSGTTTITSGSNKIVITYDGATKCDATSTVKWSLNGTDKGELTGVSCSTSAGMLLACLSTLWLVRRRRRLL